MDDALRRKLFPGSATMHYSFDEQHAVRDEYGNVTGFRPVHPFETYVLFNDEVCN